MLQRWVEGERPKMRVGNYEAKTVEEMTRLSGWTQGQLIGAKFNGVIAVEIPQQRCGDIMQDCFRKWSMRVATSTLPMTIQR